MKGKKVFTKKQADEISSLITQKLMSDSNKQKGIRNKIRKLGFYASDFGLGGGSTVDDFLRVVTIVGVGKPNAQIVTKEEKPFVTNQKSIVTKRNRNKTRDEDYVIDLCDKILGQTSLRQHRFDWLRGDSGRTLPVDAYYPSLNLVVEYMERQHTESVPHFDKRVTVSGVSRGEQRRIYDRRRQELIPKHGLSLTIINYTDLQIGRSKRLLRDRKSDNAVLRNKLKAFIR